ncbi:1,4-dihydroxy-2-naphthoate octaprenyltransferase [Sideroxyarcus emersonii]|uniref:1,4-dihydroxy-2-naphthoate octaprenyltransferase n=1 Tax=Sideroxyarcus emersonii TaxID=2764705 RepID=A0AAN1X805_9PROT|nr:prenyltransferase [Sideroxyarcus emersonii]BCK86636.1 1,4-dihydroxy-2-naphthoate octaprenyltransferase [Sideroxyarcus emersonii]
MTQPMEPTLAAFQNPLARYFAATRPAFLTASLMACTIGLAVAWHDGLAFDVPFALITLLLALLAHAGVNVLNDYYDALNGTDAQNTGRIFPFTGGSRFIQNGVLTLAQTRNLGFVLMACVAAAGLWLMARSASQLFYVGLAGLFIGWAYSAPPFRLNSRGLGELCVAAGFLAITVGADFVQRKGFAAAPFAAGLPYALLVTNLLYINQFPDRVADTAAGKLHWVARLEVRQARWGYVLIVALAYIWLLALVALGRLPLLALLALFALPLSAGASRLLLRHAAQPQQLGDAIKLTIGAMMAHGALLSLALILSKGNT